jgi:hypothetical protein
MPIPANGIQTLVEEHRQKAPGSAEWHRSVDRILDLLLHLEVERQDSLRLLKNSAP